MVNYFISQETQSKAEHQLGLKRYEPSLDEKETKPDSKLKKVILKKKMYVISSGIHTVDHFDRNTNRFFYN